MEPTLEQAAGSAREVRQVCLRVVDGPDTGSKFEGAQGEAVTVGTAEGCDLRLSDRAVSRYHAELRPTDRGVMVEDLQSRNGTFSGRVRLHAAVVPSGARLRLGGTEIEVAEQRGAALEPAEVDVPQLIGDSDAMRRVKALIRRLARGEITVLIRGETGTGKELVARAIHDLGPRKDGPFVVVDCASLPATLIASELFGHERGAFTGADQRRAGAFEIADGGTVFLDEIGELPAAVQPNLLGVLERRRFKRVGGSEELSVDVRLISATHRDLRAAVNEQSFRADLYYRIAAATLPLPPLRERAEDIPALIAHFCREATGSEDAGVLGPRTVEALVRHRWSGNIRELKNVVEAGLAMGQVMLPKTESMSIEASGGARVWPAIYKEARALALSEFEREFLSELISSCGGNASEAARRARMDRAYLLGLLRRHGLR